MDLSSANIIQAKTGSLVNGNPATVSLDNATTPGGTVTVEMYGPVVWPGMPDGWEFDLAHPAAAPILWLFRYPDMPGGETSWQWTNLSATNWAWRVTEWDTGLDPISPWEGGSGGSASGASVTSLSTGTTPTSSRASTVALAMHLWLRTSTTGDTFDWNGYTSGFTERDELRLTPLGTSEVDAAWSWAFNPATTTSETTATVNLAGRSASDTYYAMVGVYAATQPVTAPSPAIMVAG